jgi:hypothetical protein
MALFDYIGTINKKVGKMPSDDMDEFESTYNQYVVNLAFSKHLDTILIAEELTRMPNLSNLQHFEYLYHTVPKGNRWASWGKEEKVLNIEVIQEVYKYSYDKAKSVMDLFTDEDIEILKTKLITGGKEKA